MFSCCLKTEIEVITPSTEIQAESVSVEQKPFFAPNLSVEEMASKWQEHCAVKWGEELENTIKNAENQAEKVCEDKSLTKEAKNKALAKAQASAEESQRIVDFIQIVFKYFPDEKQQTNLLSSNNFQVIASIMPQFNKVEISQDEYKWLDERFAKEIADQSIRKRIYAKWDISVKDEVSFSKSKEHKSPSQAKRPLNMFYPTHILSSKKSSKVSNFKTVSVKASASFSSSSSPSSSSSLRSSARRQSLFLTSVSSVQTPVVPSAPKGNAKPSVNKK